jgi:F-type H+-transporting ATPase subunit gamma
METLETLARRMGTAEALRDLVRTMKTLAAVSIRQHERSLSALADYDRVIELGLRAVLRGGPLPPTSRPPGDGHAGVLLFGSDQGLCGTFNEQVVARLVADLEAGTVPADRLRLLAVGTRVADRAREVGLDPELTVSVPISTSSLPPLVQDLLLALDAWWDDGGLAEVALYHHRPYGTGGCRPHRHALLPVPAEQLDDLAARPWPTRMVPRHTVDLQVLLGAFARETMAVTLHRALAWSAASEHTSRLLAMQAAERNIDDRLDELRGAYHTRRQTVITTEVLDIVSGAEAVEAGPPRSPNVADRTPSAR